MSDRQADLGHTRRLLDWYDQRRPDVALLATTVALAVRVEPGLLRRARLELTPGISVAAEADLWFSPLVDSSSMRGLVLGTSVAAILRDRLAKDRVRLDAARALVSEVHEGAPPTLRLEEDLLYAGLTGDVEQVRSLLEKVLRTIANEPGRASGIARWADRAIPAMPPVVRTDPLARSLIATADRVLEAPVVVGLQLTRRGIEVSEPPAIGAPRLELPPSPLQLRVRSDAAPEDTATVHVVRGRVVRHKFRRGADETEAVEVVTADGRVARLTPVAVRARAVTPRVEKRLVICCDGLWGDRPGLSAVTNVAKLALGVAGQDADGKSQLVYYRSGVGTRRYQRLRNAALGSGLSRELRDTYRFLVQNYKPGDDLYFFGASRGAFTARSLVGLVSNCGILRPEYVDRIDEAYELYRSRSSRTHPRSKDAQFFRSSHSYETRIRFIGVWDTVGALGIPPSGLRMLNLMNRRWQFHDTELRSIVDAAFQALAIDEHRAPFAPALWTKSRGSAGHQVLEQVWFAGAHADVTGGYADASLSNIALLWMVDCARRCGLGFDPDAFQHLEVDPLGVLHDSRTGLYRLSPPFHRSLAGGGPVASSAIERMQIMVGYRPPALRDYRGPIAPIRIPEV